MDPEAAAASWEKFYVIVAGKTNEAHKTIVKRLRNSGLTEVSSPEDSDYLLIFCPVASRVGTDIGEALEDNPEKKFHVTVAGRSDEAQETIVQRFRDIGHTEVSSPEKSDYLLVFCPVASQFEMGISEALQTIPGDKPAILVVMHHTFNPDHIVADSRRQVDNPNVCLTVDRHLDSDCNNIALSELQKFLGLPVFSCFFSTSPHSLSIFEDILSDLEYVVSLLERLLSVLQRLVIVIGGLILVTKALRLLIANNLSPICLRIIIWCKAHPVIAVILVVLAVLWWIYRKK